MGRQALPLSPFTARLALALFLAVGSGVAGNLLYFQDVDGQKAGGRGRPAASRSASDADRLAALSREAARFEGDAAEPAGARATRGRAKPAAEALTHRVGSFAPSSGPLSMITAPGVDPADARRATVRTVQQELLRRGYEPGTADGAAGLVTRAAVLAYEHDQGLPLTADPSPEVLAHLRHGTSAPGAAIGLESDGQRPAAQAEQVIRSVQQSLARLGYFASPPDAQLSEETQRAIREFEMDQGLVPTGRISGPLVARLLKQAAGSPGK